MLALLVHPISRAVRKGDLSLLSSSQRLCRYFIDARVKWVRDGYLDNVVELEKNLQHVLALKNLIGSKPSRFLSVDDAARRIYLPIPASKFISKYSSIFQQFQPHDMSRFHVRLAREAQFLHREEIQVRASLDYRVNAAERLAKLLMLTNARELPLSVVDNFKYDLGLPHNYVVDLLLDFPEYFELCPLTDPSVLGLKLLLWRDDLAVSVMDKLAMAENLEFKKGMRLSFPMEFPRGFDLQKRVMVWVDEWQRLPYVSPYENAFHLARGSDQAEKWVVAVLHELLHILISKKTEKKNLFSLGDHLGFGLSFKKALVHHPGIFYISNKIRTQTVVLREGYKKSMLVRKHPLMAIRYQYVHLMNKSK